MFSDFYDDITYFEGCGFIKNTEISMYSERNIIFPSNKKNHSVRFKDNDTVKNNFLPEVSSQIIILLATRTDS